MAGNRAEVLRATVALSVAIQPVQHSAICQVKRDGLEALAPAMNQLEASAQDPCEHRSMTAAESRLDVPLSAPSLVTNSTRPKRRDSMEFNHEDEEQCRQEQHNGQEGGNQRGDNDLSDHDCELMVSFDGFGSIGKPFAIPRFNEGEEDVATVRSPILCKPLTLNARNTSQSPTCVSALARDEVVKSDADYDEPSWTIQEFQEYLGMLELLQEVSSDAEGGEMCLSADCLGQMERLLTSLLPQGV